MGNAKGKGGVAEEGGRTKKESHRKGSSGPRVGTNFYFPSFPVSAPRPPISHKFELIYMHLNLMHRHALSKQLSF